VRSRGYNLHLYARDSPALSRVSMFTRVKLGAPLSFLQPVCYSQIHPRGVCHCLTAPKHSKGRDHLSISRNASAILTDGQGVTDPSARWKTTNLTLFQTSFGPSLLLSLLQSPAGYASSHGDVSQALSLNPEDSVI